MPGATDDYIQTHNDGFLDELKEFLRMPSISTLPENRGDIQCAAEFTAASLRAVGLENVEIIATDVGEFARHLGIPTVLMGFGLPDDGIHSPNEKFCLDNYYKGIMTVSHFPQQCGQPA